MHKKIIPASLFVATFFAATTVNIHAATYTTPLFSTSTYPVQRLTWILDHTNNSNNISLDYLAKTNPNDPDIWQPLTNFSCSDTPLTCQVSLPSPLAAYLSLRLTYPDDATLQTFNLTLDETQTETPAVDSEPIYLSGFKNLDPALNPTTLSWREQELTSPVSDQIIFQTRASYDYLNWTDWQGNADTIPLTTFDPEATTASRPGYIDLYTNKIINYDAIGIIYQDEHNLYSLTTPAAAGATEADAFVNLSFTLDRTDNLRPGDTLTLTQTLGDETFRASGIVSDVKTSTNEVSVFAWQGAVPTQTADLCGSANHFCFTPAAHVHRLTTAILPAPDNEATASVSLPIYAHSGDTSPVSYAPVLDSLFFYSATAPICLEYQEVAVAASASATLTQVCRTKGLSLSHYRQNDHLPVSLQYRILYGFVGDVAVTDVFLHQDTPASTAPSSNIMTNGGYRLRGGKTFQAGNSRPYFWH